MFRCRNSRSMPTGSALPPTNRQTAANNATKTPATSTRRSIRIHASNLRLRSASPRCAGRCPEVFAVRPSPCLVPFILVVGRERAARSVHHLLQLLADLEEGRALGGDLHLLAGLRVPPLAGLAHLHLEAAEAPDLDALALLQGLGHRVEDRVHHDLGVLLRDVRRQLRHLLDQSALRHHSLPTLSGRRGTEPRLPPLTLPIPSAPASPSADRRRSWSGWRPAARPAASASRAARGR